MGSTGNKYSEKFIRQVKYLLTNKNISHKDRERILNHHISFDHIRRIDRGEYYKDVVGIEPPDNYEEYERLYVLPFLGKWGKWYSR